MTNPADSSIIACQLQSCTAYTGTGANLCLLAGGVSRVPCCNSVRSFISSTCNSVNPAKVVSVSGRGNISSVTFGGLTVVLLQIVNPNDDSLFACGTMDDGGCYPYDGDLGLAPDVCAIAGGTVQQPCCDSVETWINIGCAKVDAMLVERVSKRKALVIIFFQFIHQEH